MAYETDRTSNVEDSVAEITLNRPERLNAWNDQLGTRAAPGDPRGRADASVRAVLITGRRPRVLLGRGREGDARAAGPRDERPDVGDDAAGALPPDHQGHPGAAEAGGRRGQRARRSASAARWRWRAT